MGSFLAEHQNIFAPLIEWGGLFVLLFIVLSPFLVIRHHYFKPTRWWHIVGAYLASIFLFVAEFYISNLLYPYIIRPIITTWELYGAYGSLDTQLLVHLTIAYPLFIFYSAKMLDGKLGRKKIYVLLLPAIILYFFLFFAGFYVSALLAAYALFNNLN